MKLISYPTQLRLKRVLDNYYSFYFETIKQNRKFFLKRQRRTLSFTTQLRRRVILATNFVFSKNIKFPNYFQSRYKKYNLIPY